MAKFNSLKKLKKVREYILNIIRNLDANSTLRVDGFNERDDKAIIISHPYFENGLYGVELATASNMSNYLESNIIKSLHSKFKYAKDGFMFWTLLKKGSHQKNYVFSFSKPIALYIANAYDTNLLDSTETLNVLYDLQLDNEYILNQKQKTLKRNLDLTNNIDYELLNNKFNLLLKDAVYDNLKNTNLYQATHFRDTDNPTDIVKLFNLNFTGVIWNYISFNKHTSSQVIQRYLTNAKNSLTNERQKLDILKEEIQSNGTDTISLNTILIIDKESDSIEINSTISDCLNVTFKKDKEGKWGRKNIIKYTPLIYRDELWTKTVPISYLDKHICSVHKLPSPNAQIYGTDINNAFTSYNLYWPTPTKKNTRAHFFIGGKTGSTKTTFANSMIAQLINYDWEKDKIGDFENIKIRQFDIKKSLKAYAQWVDRHNPNSVSIMETDLNEFSYNLISINYDSNGRLDQNDIAFCKGTTSFILNAKDQTQVAGLTFDEDALYGKLIEQAYSEKKLSKIYIMELENYQPALAQELYNLGYKDSTALQDLKEPEYEYLKKPTISSVVSLLDALNTNSEIVSDPMQHQTVQSLRKKLTTIASLGEVTNSKKGAIPGFYNRYEKMNIDYKKQWLLFDMDKIKELDDYAPIQWILLNKIAHEDMKGQLKRRAAGLPEPQIIYFIEEAHNMFNNPLFRSTDGQEGILDKKAKEWRSYNMVLAPISQEVEHIPKEVLNAIETKFFLFPSKSDDMNEIEVQLKDIQRLLGLDSMPKVMELLRNTPAYKACAINEHGAFVIGLETTEKMRDVFDGKMEHI